MSWAHSSNSNSWTKLLHLVTQDALLVLFSGPGRRLLLLFQSALVDCLDPSAMDKNPFCGSCACGSEQERQSHLSWGGGRSTKVWWSMHCSQRHPSPRCVTVPLLGALHNLGLKHCPANTRDNWSCGLDGTGRFCRLVCILRNAPKHGRTQVTIQPQLLSNPNHHRTQVTTKTKSPSKPSHHQDQVTIQTKSPSNPSHHQTQVTVKPESPLNPSHHQTQVTIEPKSSSNPSHRGTQVTGKPKSLPNQGLRVRQD